MDASQSSESLDSEADQLVRDVQAALSEADSECADAVTLAERQLAAVQSGTLSLPDKLHELKRIIRRVKISRKTYDPTSISEHKRYICLMERIRGMQQKTNSLIDWEQEVRQLREGVDKLYDNIMKGWL